MAACCTYHRPTYFLVLLAAKQEPYKIAYLLTKKIEEFSWKKFRRMDQQAEKKIETVTGLGRRTREDIAKWNQVTALRFKTWGRHQTSPVSLRVPTKGNNSAGHTWDTTTNT